MNKKAEELSKLIGAPIEMIENEIDKGMWDILIELNKKGYMFNQIVNEFKLNLLIENKK